jgi:hypothetical protein
VLLTPSRFSDSQVSGSVHDDSERAVVEETMRSLWKGQYFISLKLLPNSSQPIILHTTYSSSSYQRLCTLPQPSHHLRLLGNRLEVNSAHLRMSLPLLRHLHHLHPPAPPLIPQNLKWCRLRVLRSPYGNSNRLPRRLVPRNASNRHSLLPYHPNLHLR